MKFDETELKKINKKLSSYSPEITTLIQVHLFVESYIDKYLLYFFKNGEKIVKEISFFNKLIILESTGSIDMELIRVIKELNKLRNKVAHNLDYRITQDDIDALYIGKGFKQATLHVNLVILGTAAHIDLIQKNNIS